MIYRPVGERFVGALAPHPISVSSCSFDLLQNLTFPANARGDHFVVMSATGNRLPNPNTPMAFLPPEAAKALAMQTYVTIGSLAVSLFVPKVIRELLLLCRFWYGIYSCTFTKIISWRRGIESTSPLSYIVSRGEMKLCSYTLIAEREYRISSVAYMLGLSIYSSTFCCHDLRNNGKNIRYH
jgi:hypothetical protein